MGLRSAAFPPHVRNHELDKLRGLAILLVLVAHVSDFLTHQGLVFKPLQIAASGLAAAVELFFVISGFVVSGVILSRMQTLCHTGHGRLHGFGTFLKGFYARRVFRILPLSWLVLALALLAFGLADGWTGTRLAFGVRTATAALAFGANYFLYVHPPADCALSIVGPYWSLAIEEQFYFVYPLFLILVRQRRWRLSLLALFVVLEVFWIRPMFLPGALASGHSRALFATHFRFDGIMVGCILYFLREAQLVTLQGPACHSAARRLLAWCVGGGLIIGTIAARAGLPPVAAIPTTVFISFLLVGIAARNQGWTLPSGTLGDAVFLWFGRCSYGLYLINWPLLWLMATYLRTPAVAGLGLSPLALAAVFVVVWLSSSCLLAEIAYRTVEAPLMAYGGRLGKRLEARAVAERLSAAQEAVQPSLA